MRLKYYLRGLGLGMIITAFLMGVALGGKKERLSDEEVRTRAVQLGMVDSTVLSNLKTENLDGNNSGKISPEGTDGSTGTGEPEETGDINETDILEETGDIDETDIPEETGNNDMTDGLKESDALEGTQITSQEPSMTGAENTGSGESVITIKSGDSSLTVSRSLEEAGLVGDAREYDSYLCSNGYDKFIRSGTFEIPSGSTEEEIAKIITGKK